MSSAAQAVTIVMIEDDEGHARLIEKNIRRAGVFNQINHFADGTSARAVPVRPGSVRTASRSWSCSTSTCPT